MKKIAIVWVGIFGLLIGVWTAEACWVGDGSPGFADDGSSGTSPAACASEKPPCSGSYFRDLIQTDAPCGTSASGSSDEDNQTQPCYVYDQLYSCVSNGAGGCGLETTGTFDQGSQQGTITVCTPSGDPCPPPNPPDGGQ